MPCTIRPSAKFRQDMDHRPGDQGDQPGGNRQTCAERRGERLPRLLLPLRILHLDLSHRAGAGGMVITVPGGKIG